MSGVGATEKLIHPKFGSWTGCSVRFLGCRARRNDAEWCDRAGRSSAFRRKVRPCSGMRRHNAVAASPTLPDPCFAGPLMQRFEAPHSKELQRSHVPQKLLNPPRSELIKKTNIKQYKKTW